MDTQPLEIHPSLGTDKREEKARGDRAQAHELRLVGLGILSHQLSPGIISGNGTILGHMPEDRRWQR